MLVRVFRYRHLALILNRMYHAPMHPCTNAPTRVYHPCPCMHDTWGPGRAGDLKADNVCVTAWNWVFVVDWAPFKPVLVPSDNPAIFSFFFDTAPSGRRRCCIAPE
ncbi:unnamed protein product, partial [Closterium sp. NIES-54]